MERALTLLFIFWLFVGPVRWLVLEPRHSPAVPIPSSDLFPPHLNLVAIIPKNHKAHVFLLQIIVLRSFLRPAI